MGETLAARVQIKTLSLESAVVAQLKRNLLEAKVNISEICPVASGLRAPRKVPPRSGLTSSFCRTPAFTSCQLLCFYYSCTNYIVCINSDLERYRSSGDTLNFRPLLFALYNNCEIMSETCKRPKNSDTEASNSGLNILSYKDHNIKDQ